MQNMTRASGCTLDMIHAPDCKDDQCISCSVCSCTENIDTCTTCSWEEKAIRADEVAVLSNTAKCIEFLDTEFPKITGDMSLYVSGERVRLIFVAIARVMHDGSPAQLKHVQEAMLKCATV